LASTSSYFNEKIRLWSGLIVLFYLATHLLNHASGVFGIDFMEKSREFFLLFWRNPVLNYLVVVSLLVHLFFTLFKVLYKKSLKGMRTYEWFQFISGLIIPITLIPHVVSTKVLHELYQINDSYTLILINVTRPDLIYFLFVILFCWGHGLIGLTYYLNLKPWYPKVKQYIFSFGIVIPLLATMGIFMAKQEISFLEKNKSGI